ncbi:MAG: CoA-binding protein [Planctomycetes bacterium]|nr:CoA-binding protein [Planctomycetota bacterium]
MLEHFFSPKTVVVVGASREKGKVGHDILKNLVQYGYKGRIYPVNPKAEEIVGLKTYSGLNEIHDKLDLAIIVVPAHCVGEIIDECAEKKIDSIIVISAGFKESGVEGAIREQYLYQKITRHSMRLLGPNCLGLIDTQSCLNASFAADMPEKGNIAFFSQSGALCTAILDWAADECVGFSKFISMGNKTDINEVDLINAMHEDENTKVILGYLEGVKNGKDFIAVARKVSKKKPLILVKSGGTAAGSKAASSHTGTLAGSERAFDAAFKQSGVIRAHTIEQLFDFARIFSYQQLPKGARVALVTNAGGPGIIAADAIERSVLKMAELSKDTIETLRRSLPSMANVYNPIDVLGDAKSDRYRFVIENVIKDPNVDAILAILTPQAMTEIEKTAEVICEIANRTDKTIATSFMGGKRTESALKIMCQKKVPNYPFPERAISAIEAMYKYTLWQKKPAPETKKIVADEESVRTVFNQIKKTGAAYLSEESARHVISAYGFAIPKSIIATSEADAAKAAEDMGYPVVMKISSPDILHKSDIGGVVVGVKNEQEVKGHFSDIMRKARHHMPEAEIKGIMIQQLVAGGKETVLGVSYDPQFGHLIMFGLGGIYVEVLRDVTFRIAPVDINEAREMIREIRSFPLLKGVRGEKSVDMDAIVENILRLSQLVTDFPEIIEMDINPLVVFPEGKGAIAIDARIAIHVQQNKRIGGNAF